MLLSVGILAYFIIAIGIIFYLKLKHYQLSSRVLSALLLGLLGGVLLKYLSYISIHLFIRNVLYLIGNGYLALLKMLVIPLILTSIIQAILNLGQGNSRDLKRMSLMTCAMLLGMTAISSLIGIYVAKWFQLGMNLNFEHFNLIAEMPVNNGIVETLLSMIPSNPFLMLTQENTIAVVIFSVLLGLAARALDEKDHDKMLTFTQFINSMFAIIKKLASFILSLTPYGVFALLTLLVNDQGIKTFNTMLNFIFAMYVAMFFVMLMHSLIIMLLEQPILQYFKKAYLPLFVAFTTRSSFGTLPVTEETLREQFKTDQAVATFVPSIGATIGMNACAGIFPAVLVVMTLNLLHQPITAQLIMMVMFINMIASLGISGIPGTAYIAATVTLSSLHLPYTIIALVQGIDPIVDMGRTAVNVNGVMTTALFVNRFRKKEK